MHRFRINPNLSLPVGALDAGGILCRWLVLAPRAERIRDINSPQIRLQVDHIALDGADIVAADEAEDVALRVGINTGHDEIVVALRVLFLLPGMGGLCIVGLA